MLDDRHMALLPSHAVRAELRALVAQDRRLRELARPVQGLIDPDAIVDVRSPAGARLCQMVRIPTAGLPGRLLVGPTPGYGPDAAQRLDALLRWGLDGVVCLVPAMDFGDVCGCPDYGAMARARWGERFTVLDVVDYEAPGDDAPFEAAVDATVAALVAGDSMLIHCVLGCGRTGMFVACVLVALGAEPHDAIATYRDVRRCGPESTDQLAYVVRYAGRRQARRRSSVA